MLKFFLTEEIPMSIKEIIENTTRNLANARNYIELIGDNSSDELLKQLDDSVRALNTIPDTILVALCAAVYAGNIESDGKGFVDDFGADSLTHRAEYLEIAEQYELPIEDGLIQTDVVYNDISEIMYSKYAIKE
jgi:hypothetical protein